MKILIFNWRCWKNPLAGGVEKYLYEISKRLVKKGYKITWFTSSFKGAKERELVEGIEIIRKGGRFSVYLHAFFEYLKELRKRKFDVVIDSINGVPFFTPLYIWKPKKIAIIHHIIGWKTFSKELKFYQAILAWIAEKLVPIIYFFIPFITVSESTKRELKVKNIAIVPNGVDEWLFQNQIEKSHIPVVIYLGRWKKYKRLDLLLEAFKLVKKNIKNAELWLAGHGDWKPNYVEGLKIFGRVNEAKKKELLSKAWVFVIPSEKEGWGITVIEANACGTPAIGYNVPGLRDSIVHGKTGFLIKEDGNVKKLAEVIIKVLTDAKLREKLSKNAIEWAKQFSWDKSAERFEKIIKCLLKN